MPTLKLNLGKLRLHWGLTKMGRRAACVPANLELSVHVTWDLCLWAPLPSGDWHQKPLSPRMSQYLGARFEIPRSDIAVRGRLLSAFWRTGLYYNLTTPNIFKIIVNFFKSWTFISRLPFLSHICDLNTPLFVLFLWQTLSIAVFSILLNQLRHHIINAPKNWGSVAFMVNCILNFPCAVFTFQASLHISCSDPYFACMKGLSSVPLSPLRRAFLHSNAIMQLTIRVQMMFLHNYILHSSDQQYSSCSRQRVALTLEISRGPGWSWMDPSSQS